MTESEPLIFYSQMVYYLTNYLHETKQSAYVVVNSHHQPLWICMKSVGEYSAIGAKIGA